MSKSLKHQFIDWVREQPAHWGYEYVDASRCAFALFLQDVGLAEGFCVSPGVWMDLEFKEHPLPEGVDEAVRGEPRTFGALLTRLEASEPEQ